MPKPTYLKSIFTEQIVKEIYQSGSLEDGVKLIKETIDKHPNIKSDDKNKMLYELNRIPSLTKLQFYVTNLVFKYEGLGVESWKKK